MGRIIQVAIRPIITAFTVLCGGIRTIAVGIRTASLRTAVVSGAPLPNALGRSRRGPGNASKGWRSNGARRDSSSTRRSRVASSGSATAGPKIALRNTLPADRYRDLVQRLAELIGGLNQAADGRLVLDSQYLLVVAHKAVGPGGA